MKKIILFLFSTLIYTQSSNSSMPPCNPDINNNCWACCTGIEVSPCTHYDNAFGCSMDDATYMEGYTCDQLDTDSEGTCSVICPDCVDNDDLVSPLGCATAVDTFGCEYSWGDIPISDACPFMCGTCPTIPDGDCDCDGNQLDCNDDCGGDAMIDMCGFCDNDPVNDCVEDCSGDWGGEAVYDTCGECSDGESGHDFDSDIDCYGVCFGEAVYDTCGECSGGDTGHDFDSDLDCNGDCFGEAVYDTCGECSGGDTGHYFDSDLDCNGDCWGAATVDSCGECSGGDTGHEADSDLDCNGDCFGEAVYDTCGECSDGESGHYFDSDLDCNGDCWGAATVDSCWECSGGDTGHEADSDLDCNGDCFGSATVDSCGVCFGGNSGFEENSILDECGICDGDNSSCDGCTDPNALNYDPDAIVDDGGCEYMGDVYVAVWGDNESGTGLPNEPFQTIQHAINVANDGDTVVVTPGTYFDNNIIFPTYKSLTVWGLDGPEATTLTDEWQIVYYEDFEEYAHLDSSEWEAGRTGCTGEEFIHQDGFNNSNSLYVYTNDCSMGYQQTYAYSPIYQVGEGNYMLGYINRRDWASNCDDYWRVYYSLDGGDWSEIDYEDCDRNNFHHQTTDSFTVPSGEHTIQIYFIQRVDAWSNFYLDDVVIYKQFENDDRDVNSSNPIFSIANIQDHTINIEGLTLDKSHAIRGRIFEINNSESVHIKNIIVEELDESHNFNYENISTEVEDGQYIYIEDSNVSFDNISFSDINMYSMYSRYGIIHIDESTVSFNNLSMTNIIAGSVENLVGSGVDGNCLYIEYNSDVTINNSLFQNSQIYSNTSTHGGVIYLKSDNDESYSNNLIINNTSFINNGIYTDDDGEYGGVIYSQDHNNIIINDSNFDSNFSGPSGEGAAIWMDSRNTLQINNSEFTNHVPDENNYYTRIGGVIRGQSYNNISLNGCIFDNNYANDQGGTIYLDHNIDLDIINTSITTSVANSNGGAIHIEHDSRIDALNSHFDNNTSGDKGGGIYFSGKDTLILYNSTIDNNTSNGNGGGVHFDHHEVYIDAFESSISGNSSGSYKGAGIYGQGVLNMNYSEINDNTCENDGGGIYWYQGQVTIQRSDIRRNHANRGGGLFILAENPIFQYDVIALNDATTVGGGMYIAKEGNSSSTPIIFNSTVVYNTSAVLGSGMLCTSQTNPVVQNSIFWGNLAADGVQMHLQGSSEIFVTYSDIAGGVSGIVGFDDIIFQNNIDDYPDFTDFENEDYTLLVTSLAIDGGNPNAPYDPDGSIADIGAYYYDQVINVPGCMEESAQNYDPDANIDLGCIYGPDFISIYDVPDDQGGYVFLNWEANSLDVLPETIITHYSAWRYVPNERGWEHLGDSPAGYEEDYTFTAPTIEISTLIHDGNGDTLVYVAKYTEFKIKAHTSDPTAFYESETDWGCSWDNVAPATPELSSSIEEQAVHLTWSEPVENDFSYFTIYEGDIMIAETTVPSLTDNPGYGEYSYTATATDVHNNVSPLSDAEIVITGMFGDSNADFEVNVLDIVEVVNFVLGNAEPSDYAFWAADVNEDGILNILDIVAIVNMILEDSLSRMDNISESKLEYGNGKLSLTADGSIAGIQLEVTGSYILTNNNLPDRWQLHNNENVILIYNMGGEDLSSDVLFEYEGDLSVISNIIADWNGGSLSADVVAVPDAFSISPAYPNPFNPTTTLSFAIPTASDISLSVYNMQGREVASLINGNMQPGYHSILWDANNHSSGIYFVKMIAGEYINTQKLMLVK